MHLTWTTAYPGSGRYTAAYGSWLATITPGAGGVASLLIQRDGRDVSRRSFVTVTAAQEYAASICRSR